MDGLFGRWVIVAALLSFTALAGAEEREAFLARAEESVAAFEAILEERFLADPEGAPLDSLNGAIREYNAWNLAEGDRLDGERKAIEEERLELNRLEAEIGRADEKLAGWNDASGGAALRERESTIALRRRLVERYETKAEAHRARIEAFNEVARVFSEESEARRAALDARREELDRRIEEHRIWRESGGEEDYWRDLNRFYAALRNDERHGGGWSSRLDDLIGQVRAIRSALGARAARTEREKENGLLVVPARLGGEEAWFIVDTGASLLSLSPELVDALGWTPLLGDTLESAVAGGLKAAGRSLTVPEIEVLGVVARDVSAKALVESHPGVDGLLGRSFLSRFKMIVDDRAEPRVRLEERR